MKYLFVFFIAFAICSTTVYSIEKEETIGDVISRYFSNEKNVNIPIVDFSYGPEKLSFNSGFNSLFEGNYSTEIQYGYIRYDKDIAKLGFIYFSSERAFLGSTSSRFKLTPVDDLTIKTDIYRYGGLYNNGFGYGTEGSKFLFSHSSAIVWTESDVENFAFNDPDNQLLTEFEDENNFGMFYTSGVNYTFGNGATSIELRYRHNVVWTDFQFGNWIGSWAIENALQRAPDLFHQSMIEQFGGYYPLMYHAYKTLISYFIYERRGKSTYWPFKGSKVLNFRSIVLGVKFPL